MVPFESLGMVSCSSSIAAMAVSLAVYEIFSVKEFEKRVRSCSRLVKMAPFDRPYTTFYWSAIYLVPFSIYLALNSVVTLKSRFGITLGHWKWHHSKAWVRFPICLP